MPVGGPANPLVLARYGPILFLDGPPRPHPGTLEPEIIQPMRPFNWQQFNESEMPSEAGTVLRRFANGEKLTLARVSFAADSPMRTRMGSLRSSSPTRWSSDQRRPR